MKRYTIKYKLLKDSDIFSVSLLKHGFTLNAFIMPQFQYCSTIWHFCSARNSEKLELLDIKSAHMADTSGKSNTNGLRGINKLQIPHVNATS